ncbi:MAG: hypothetical protein DMD81_13855, partial [Candidatus Rokuibacteriota bacterium]
MTRVIAFALHQRFITLALALLLTAGGIAAFSRLPIEAYPDVADIEVDVITLWPGHAAEEVERYITIQIEKELNGIANVTFLRSFSNFGLSNIRVLFADGTDNYWARQQVQERIAQAELPADAKPGLGPLASVIGEVYRYTLESKTMPLVELKALEDWTLEREFRKVPGVVDVVSWGGGIKQYQVTVDPGRLRAYNLTLKQVFDAITASNANAGGSYLRQGEYALMVRGIGLIQSLRDVEEIVVAAQKGTPVRVRDIATVGIGHAIRFGVLGRDHDDDLVQGIVLMRKGENPGAVIDGVRKKIAGVQQLLPPGVTMRPYYSRDVLVRTTVTTVLRNLVEGAILVVLLLTLFLHPHGPAGDPGESPVARRDRLRHHRRRRGHHDREHPPPSRREEGDRSSRRPRSAARRHGGRAAAHVRRADHHDRVRADPHVPAHRGQAVPPDGGHDLAGGRGLARP